VIFGWLSDKVGRKPIIMAGCLLAALTYFPIFKALTHYGNPAIEAAAQTSPVVVTADPSTCTFQFNPVGTSKFTTSCDIAKSVLGKGGTPFSNTDAAPGTVATVAVGDVVLSAFEGAGHSAEELKADSARFNNELQAALTAAGYPEK